MWNALKAKLQFFSEREYKCHQAKKTCEYV